MANPIDLKMLLSAPVCGKRVGRVLDVIRPEVGEEATTVKARRVLYPARHFRDIYELRLRYLAERGKSIEPTLIDAVLDLTEYAGEVYGVTISRSDLHVVLFMSRRDEVVAGYLYRVASGDEWEPLFAES